MTSAKHPLVRLGLVLCLAVAGTLDTAQITLAQTPSTQQEVGGIGVQTRIDEKTKQLIIQLVASGGAAEKAGLKPGDIILEVDGKTVIGERQNQTISRIRGVIGTPVNLKLQRGNQTITVDIIRGKIQASTEKEQADTLITQGIQAHSTSDFRGAMEKWNQALKIYLSIGDKKGEGNAYGGLGIAYDSLGDYPKAIEFQNKSLLIALQIGDKQGEGAAYGNLGNAYDSLGDYPKAIEFHNKALQIDIQIGDKKGEGQDYGNLGAAYRSLSNYPKAIEFHNKALQIDIQIGDKKGEGQDYGNLGAAYQSLGDYPKAIEFHNKALQIDIQIGDKKGEGAAYGNLGIAYKNLGDYPKAIEFQNKRLQIALQIGDKQGEGAAYGNLGNAYGSLGDYPKAIEFQNKRLLIALQIGDKQGEGAAYGNLGLAYRNLSDYQKSIEFHNKQLKIFTQIGDKQGEGNAYGNLGTAYYSLGDYQKAIEFHNKALQIDIQIGDKNGEGADYGGLGIAYVSLGDYQKAIEFQNKSLLIALQISDKQGEGNAYGNLGNAYDSLGDYQKAIEYYNKSLLIALQIGDKYGEGTAYGNLGIAYYSLGDYPKAIEFHNKALQILQQIGDKYGEGQVYGNLGAAYENLNQYDEALLLQQKSIAIYSAIGSNQNLYYPQWAIARTLLAQEKPDLAILFYKQAVNTVQSTKERIKDLDPALKKSFGESKSSVYRQLADLLLKQGRVLEAQKVLDLLKEQETIEYLRSALRSSSSGGDAQLNDSEQKVWKEYTSSILGNELKLYQRRNDILAQIKQIPLAERDSNPTYQSLKPKLKEAQDKIDALTPAFGVFLKQAAASLKSTENTKTADQLQEEIDKYKNLLANRKAALISPLVLPDRLELILLTPNLKPLQRTVKVPKADLDKLVLRLRQNLSNPSGNSLQDLQQLYQWLIAPFESEIQQLLKDKTIDTLVFAPDENLRLIPMAALHDGKQYLIEKMPVGTIDRLSTLTDKATQKSQMLAMGLSKAQAQYPEFAALPGVSEEVRTIGKLYNGPVLLDERFTKEQLKENLLIATGDGQGLILHMATHASFGVNKDKTFILMFKDKLTLDDLKSLELRNVSLLTLSACETASTDGRSGIGLASVAEASGGAQSVLGSLWEVSDNSTSLLMQRLYANLKAGMPKAEALRQTQLTLIQGQASTSGQTDNRGGVVPLPNGKSPSRAGGLSDPFYWAPFILIGDWR
jgi:CHAT domain-containing protein/Flp pilus assembly protein TadD